MATQVKDKLAVRGELGWREGGDRERGRRGVGGDIGLGSTGIY